MAKTSAIVFGIIFLIAGIWGLFMSPVIGFIAADKVSSIIHIIVGIVLLVMSKKNASGTLKTIGIIYIIFAILGFIGGTTVLHLFVTDMATTWFYLVVGIIVAALGWSSKKGMAAPAAPATPQM